MSQLKQLIVFRDLLQDDLLKKVAAVSKRNEQDDCFFDTTAQLVQRAEEVGLEGNLFVEYLLYRIGQAENVFSSTAEKNGGRIGQSLFQAVVRDVEILKAFCKESQAVSNTESVLSDYHPTHRMMNSGHSRLREYFLDISKTYSAEDVVEMLSGYYRTHGCGDMMNYFAFRWDSERGLVGISQCDDVKLDDIVGYERQKRVLLQNTEAFIAGRPANNVLLVGARGTGKSSSVKAIANRYAEKGLRLVEVSKNDLNQLHDIMDELRRWGKRFILFLDDLSFEEFEVEYKQLKSVMDGGVAIKPDNVLIYATSNRRHLVREVWKDRAGDEVHQMDTVNEKISLSDRFGIVLTYNTPNQDEYLKIVEEIAKRSKITVSREEIRAEALKWEIAHSGRSGRTARQFVIHLAGKSAPSENLQ